MVSAEDWGLRLQVCRTPTAARFAARPSHLNGTISSSQFLAAVRRDFSPGLRRRLLISPEQR